MAAGRKEYELLLKLKAALGGGFNSTFQTAMTTTKKLQNSLQSIKKVQGDISAYKKASDAISAQKKTVQDLAQRHTELQQKLAATVAREKEIQKALEKSKKATGTETEEYRRLKAELEKTQAQKEKYTKQLKDNATATEKVKNKIAEQEQKLGDLSTRLQAAGVDTNNLTQENEKLEKAYDRVKKSQEDLARVNGKIEENKAAISATKTELVKTVGVLSAAGAGFYKGFIAPAANFQEQMSTVQAISGATAEEMAQLNEIAKKMGATTKFTAVESGKALEYMAMAGWDANAMTNGLAGVMSLAAASGEDLATVSDIVTDAMTAFGMKADEANRFADVLAATATSSNTNVGIMGETFKHVAPLAGAMGYSIEDMSVAIGMMANAGVKGSKAGTSLKNIVTNLAKPSKEVTAAMNELGVSLTNNDGTTKSFEEVVQSLRTSFDGLTEAEKASYAATIGGKQGMAGLLAIVNSGEDDFAKLTATINDCNGAAEQMAATRLDNLPGDITLMKSAWDGLATTIGELFLPNMRSATQSITKVIEKANEFVKANPQLIKTLVGVAGGLGVAKVGALAGKLGFLEMKGGVLEAAKSLLGFKAKAAEAAAGALTGSSDVVSFGKKLTDYFGGVKNSIGNVGGSIDKLANGKLSGVFSKIGSGIQSGVLKPLSGISNKVTGALGSTGSKITSYFGKIGKTVANGPLGKIGGVFKSIGGAAGSVLGGPLKGLGSLFGGLFGKAMPVIMILSALSILFMKLSGEDISGFIEPLRVAFEQIKPVLQNVMEQFKELGKQIMPVLMETVKKLAPLLGNIVTAILPIVLEVIQQLVPLLIQIIGTVLPVILDVIGQLAPLLTEIITAILPVALQLIQMLLPIITQLVTSVLPIIVEVLNMLMPIITQLIQAVLPVLMSLLQALMPVITVLADLFSNVLGIAIEAISGIISNLMQVFQGIIDFITGVFTGNWTQAWEGIKSIFGGAFGAIVELAKAPLRAVVSVINTVIGGLNKLKIPDWVPGLGGKGINIPLIPTFSKGTDYTPDTFIAGDINGEGGELVTGARGRKVFTAAQTNNIFDNINRAKAINNANPAPTALKAPPQGGGQTFTIQYSPTIYVDGDKPGDLEEKLKENNLTLLEMFKEFLRQQREDERRTGYA